MWMMVSKKTCIICRYNPKQKAGMILKMFDLTLFTDGLNSRYLMLCLLNLISFANVGFSLHTQNVVNYHHTIICVFVYWTDKAGNFPPFMLFISAHEENQVTELWANFLSLTNNRDCASS